MMKKIEKQLFVAVKNQSDQEVVKLLTSLDNEFKSDAERPDLNLRDEDWGFTLLHWAIKRGLLATVIRLLDKRIKADIKNRQGYTPLLFALNQLPLRKTDDPAVRFITDTSIFKIIEKLFSYDPDITSKEPDPNGIGYTSLHIAVRLNQPLVLKALLINQKDPAKCLEVTDRIGSSPFHLACAIGDVHMVSFMLNELKVNPNFQNTKVHPMFENSRLNSSEGYTPLHYAVEEKRSQVVSLLIKAGADLSIGTVGDAGLTPLVMAQRMSNKEMVAIIEKEVHLLTSPLDPEVTEVQMRDSNALTVSRIQTEQVADDVGKETKKVTSSLQPKTTETQKPDSHVLTQSFIASPVHRHMAQPLEQKKNMSDIDYDSDKIDTIASAGITYRGIRIIFERISGEEEFNSNWRLQVLNVEEETPQYSMISSDPKFNSRMALHLKEGDLPGFITFLKGKDHLAEEISEYVQKKISSVNTTLSLG